MDFWLATFTNAYGSSSEQRTFWLIDYFVAGRCDTCIPAVIEREVPIEDAVHRADIAWDTYTPLESCHLQQLPRLTSPCRATLQIANFAATVNFIDGSISKYVNLVPRQTPIFNATPQFPATLALGLPLSLGVGIQLPPIRFNKTASINEERHDRLQCQSNDLSDEAQTSLTAKFVKLVAMKYDEQSRAARRTSVLPWT